MKKRFQVTSFYTQQLDGQLSLLAGADGVIPIVLPEIEENKDFFVLIDPLNQTGDRLVVRCYIDGGQLKYYGRSFTGNHTYYSKTLIQINDVAELFNIAYQHIDDFGFVEQTNGLDVMVRGGRIINTALSDTIISDQELTLPDNSTCYVYFNNVTNLFEFQLNTEPDSFLVCAKVITLLGSMAIEDYRGNNLGIGAEMQSLTQAEIDSIANLRDGMLIFNRTTGLPEYYGGGMWFEISTGTVTPRASEIVEGKVSFQTELEFLAETDIRLGGDPLVTRPSMAKQYVDDLLEIPITTLANDSFIVGEAISKGNSLFVEDYPTFAGAIKSQNIGDEIASRLIGVRALGSGVSGNTMNLSLAKFGTPGVDLKIRIETDNAGAPSGTLFHANAIATVLESGLTTTLVDTLVTFAGSLNIPRGETVWIMLYQGNYGSETYNGTSYYLIGGLDINTLSRYSRKLDGGAWTNGGFNVSHAYAGIMAQSASNTTSSMGHLITVNKNCKLKSVTKLSSTPVTRAILRNNAGAILATASFSGDIATFTTSQSLSAGTNYRIEADNNGSNYLFSNDTGYDASTNEYLNYVGGSQNGANSTAGAVISMQVISEYDGYMNYVRSGIFESYILSKTSALFSYKLPSSGIFSTENYISGDVVKYDFMGLTKTLSSIVYGTNYYVSDTLGIISITPGTNPMWIGQGISDTSLILSGLTKSSSILNNTLYIADTTGIVTAMAKENTTGGSGISGYADYGTATTLVSGNKSTTTLYPASISFPVLKGQRFKVIGAADSTLQYSGYFTSLMV